MIYAMQPLVCTGPITALIPLLFPWICKKKVRTIVGVRTIDVIRVSNLVVGPFPVTIETRGPAYCGLIIMIAALLLQIYVVFVDF